MLFEKLLKNTIIFNTSWEDPEVDRSLWKIDENSIVLNISSAGDNSLDFLLDNPKKIISTDINVAQTSVVELKKVIYQNCTHDTLWKFFGDGGSPDTVKIYAKELRSKLSEKSSTFWDDKIQLFRKKKKFYRSGLSGKASKILMNYFKLKGLKKDLNKLFKAESIEEQNQIYPSISEKLWRKSAKVLLNTYPIHYFLGVPRSQFESTKNDNETLFDYLKWSVSKILTEMPTKDNYFWKLYFYGHYDENCPNYLKKENFDFYKSNIEKLQIENLPIGDLIDNNEVTHLNLLDHQDWHIGRGSYIPDFWDKIVKKESIKEVIFRTASGTFPLPDFVKNHFAFTDKSKIPHGRVGTYFRTYHLFR